MGNVLWLQLATYIIGVFILVAFAVKLAGYARMPVHLRWELYPLAGEKKRPWGGSYLEESEWWNRLPEKKSLVGEMEYMGKEVLYFKEYYHRNRGYWYVLYPFHAGIFLFVGFVVLLVVGALTMWAGVAVSAESASLWGRLLYFVTLITGGAGFLLGTIGCIGLFIRRLADRYLKPYTRRVDYINLLFVMAVFVTGLVSWLIADGGFSNARNYVKGLITFSAVGGVAPVTAAHILLLLALLLYMPFTNMMHFFAKWFTYHKVRWDDVPNLRGSRLERELGPLLGQPLSWAAPHVQSRVKVWGDTAQAATREHAVRTTKGVS